MITPERGKVYVVKHSSGFVEARFIAERILNGIAYSPFSQRGRSRIHYIFQNLKTGRDIEIKSRQKIHREVCENQGA